MDTRRSKSTVDVQETSPNKDRGKDIVEKQGNNSSEQESVSDSVDSKTAEAPDSASPNKEQKGMVTRSFGKSPNKEVKSKKESEGKGTPSKNKSSPMSDTTRDSPPPKRKKTLDKREEINFIDLSGNDDDESSQDDDEDDDDSSSGDPLRFEPESKTTFSEKPNVSAPSVALGGGNLNNTDLPKTGNPALIKVKRVVKGANEGEINVLTSYEAGGSPAKISQCGETIPESAKKYMVLDKTTIQDMVEKGLVQTIKKDGANQTIATYRAIVPKGDSSILNKLASASVTSLPIVRNTNPVFQTMETSKPTGNPALSTTFKPISVASTSLTTALPTKSMMTFLGSPTSVSSVTTLNSSAKVFVPSSGVKIHIPPSTLANGKASGIQQVFTSPIYVKTPITSSAGKQTNMQVVTLPPEILQQLQTMQKKTGGASSATSGTTGKPIFTIASGSQQTIKVMTKGRTVATPITKKYNTEDPDDPPAINISDDSEEDGFVKKKDGAKYSVVSKSTLTGVPAAIVNKTGNANIRWVAVANKSAESKPGGGAPAVSNAIPIRFSTSGKDSGAGNSQSTKPVIGNLRRILNEMKMHHARLISKHRTRYSRLQKKFQELERDFKEVEDVGTPQQIVRDAKQFLSAEHSLFFESQLFLNNTEGKGNRFSKSFMKLMIDLYDRSPAGYSYLKTVFTVPSIKTIKKLQARGFCEGNDKISKSPRVFKRTRRVKQGKSKVASNTSTKNLPAKVILVKPDKSTIVKKYGEKRDFIGFPSEKEKSVMVDSKEWFRSAMNVSQSLPAPSGQTLFLNNDSKKPLMNIKMESDIDIEDMEEEEMREDVENEDVDIEGGDGDGSASSNNFQTGQSDDVGDAEDITTFDIPQKMLVVPDNETPSKQDMTLQWDEPWGSIE